MKKLLMSTLAGAILATGAFADTYISENYGKIIADNQFACMPKGGYSYGQVQYIEATREGALKGMKLAGIAKISSDFLSKAGISTSVSIETYITNYSHFICSLSFQERKELGFFFLGSFQYKAANKNKEIALLNMNYASKQMAENYVVYDETIFLQLLQRADNRYDLRSLRRLFSYITMKDFASAKKLTHNFYLEVTSSK